MLIAQGYDVMKGAPPPRWLLRGKDVATSNFNTSYQAIKRRPNAHIKQAFGCLTHLQIPLIFPLLFFV